MASPKSELIEKFSELARYIAENAREPLPLAHLAERVHLSASRFQRVFKSIFGVSPKQFQQAARTEKFKALLKSGGDITTAIFAAGYGSTSRVYGKAMRNIGMTPKSYRAGGEGEVLTWACRDTLLGPLMMAATDRGVCFAQFGESSETLRQQLQNEFPRAELVGFENSAGHQLDQWIDALNAYLKNRQPRPELPLDLKGTAFQIRVWQFLLSLDDGDVVSYSELASAIENPKAVRAVASACAANRVAVLVPCHRILRSDGGLGGYRWGVDRKRSLLDMERSRVAPGSGRK
jgi:AraC family transcriptional regulator of adaptative response/methylated-DNA-[protein]-cysteine methyltransferase